MRSGLTEAPRQVAAVERQSAHHQQRGGYDDVRHDLDGKARLRPIIAPLLSPDAQDPHREGEYDKEWQGDPAHRPRRPAIAENEYQPHLTRQPENSQPDRYHAQRRQPRHRHESADTAEREQIEKMPDQHEPGDQHDPDGKKLRHDFRVPPPRVQQDERQPRRDQCCGRVGRHTADMPQRLTIELLREQQPVDRHGSECKIRQLRRGDPGHQQGSADRKPSTLRAGHRDRAAARDKRDGGCGIDGEIGYHGVAKDSACHAPAHQSKRTEQDYDNRAGERYGTISIQAP
jgi:hypothetical protein